MPEKAEGLICSLVIPERYPYPYLKKPGVYNRMGNKLINNKSLVFINASINMAPRTATTGQREINMGNPANSSSAIDENVFREIQQTLAQIQYGSLEISIHNGQIVQLERREKKRIGKGDNSK